MAKTIQVRVDDKLKNSADALFASLGLDTSTAVRMFLVQATETGGIPFAISKSTKVRGKKERIAAKGILKD